MKASKIAGVAIVAGATIAIAIASLPFGAPFVQAAMSGGKLDQAWIPHAFQVLEGGPESLIEYAKASASAEGGIAHMLAWFAIVAGAIVLFACYQAAKSPKREVENGILGKQSSIKTAGEIIESCPMWNGRSEPSDGVVLGFVRGKAAVLECVHCAVCAPSGSKKTRGSVYPTIDALSFSGRNNLLVTDPSLEIYCMAGKCLAERGYEVHLLDLDNPRQGSRFNPLKIITDLSEAGKGEFAEDRAREIGSTLFPERGNENDIFVNAAGGVFAACAFAVATLPGVPGEERHLWSVVKTVMAGTLDGATALKDWIRGFGPESPVAAMAATFLASEGKLESSILASLHDGLQPFTSQNMRWLTSASDLGIDEMMAGRSAVFVHTLGPGAPANRIASLFLAQHWAETQRLGKRRGLRPCWVVGDEFHSLPKFDLPHALEQARKYGLHYVMYTQSFSGYDQYKTQKEDGKDAILANCDVKALYKAGSDLDARYFETLGGFKTIRARNTGEQRQGVSRSGSSEGFSEQKVPLWPQGDVLERNPEKDGVLVVQSALGARKAGKFEIPVVDASKTFVSDHFKTLGTPDFERKVIADTLDELEAKAEGIAIDLNGWQPDFEACKSDKTKAAEIADDEFAAWD